MTQRKILFHSILLLSMVATAFAQDTIVLNNGDILTGTILKQDEQHVYFKSAAFGSVGLNTRDIAEIRIQSEELGEIAVPAVALAPQATNATQSVTEVADVPPPRSLEKNPWSGQTGLAIAMRENTRSNQKGVISEDQFETYRFYGNIDWNGIRNNLQWNWTYRYSRDEDEKRDDFFNVTQLYKYAFKDENYFATAKTLYQRDYNRRIENEYLQTAELGLKWFGQDSRIQLSTSAGGGYHQYERISSDRTELTEIKEPKFIFDQALQWRLINSLSLNQKFTHLGNLTDYHFLFSTGLENKLINELFVRVEYRLDRDTEVYYDDKGYYDKALLTSVLYKF